MLCTNVARTKVAWTSVTMTAGICLRWSQELTFKVWSKTAQYKLRYSWYGQMSHEQMLPVQTLLWHLESVQDGPRNLRLKFCQNRFSNSWDIIDIEFSVVEQPRLIWWAATAYMVVCKVILTSNPTFGYVRLNWGFDNYIWAVSEQCMGNLSSYMLVSQKFRG